MTEHSQPPDQLTQMAIHRSALAATRSLMAWVRTSLIVIGFGYTFDHFLEAFPTVASSRYPDAARNVKLLIMALGTAIILLGWAQYRQDKRELRERYQETLPKFATAISGLAAALGALLLLSTLLRIT